MVGWCAAEVPRRCAGHPGKWYNMYSIDMSGKLPMCRRTENAQVRYSAACPMGREHGKTYGSML